MVVGRRGVLVVLVMMLVCLRARRAHADQADAPPATRSWYGWQILISEGTGIALGTTLAFARPPADTSGTRRLLPLWGGMAAVGFAGPPVMHFIHGHRLRGVGDLGLRLGAPVVSLVIGVAGFCLSRFLAADCADRSLAPSLLVGTVAAAWFDVASLGWDEAPPPGRATVTVVPSAIALSGGGLFGVRGSFF